MFRYIEIDCASQVASFALDLLHRMFVVYMLLINTELEYVCACVPRARVCVCVEVLRPSQPNGVMSSAVSLL